MPDAPLLGWHDSSHWSQDAKPCRHCGRPTHLRNDQRRPADKVCEEAALAKQTADTTRTYQNGTL